MKLRSRPLYSLWPPSTPVVKTTTSRARSTQGTQPRKIRLGVICLERAQLALRPPAVRSAPGPPASPLARVPPVRTPTARTPLRTDGLDGVFRNTRGGGLSRPAPSTLPALG